MKKEQDQHLADLRHLKELRALAPTLAPQQRRVVDRISDDLQERIGPVVPKRRASRLLEVSVPTLDAWIRRKRIVAAPTAGGRTGVDTGSLIWAANRIPVGASRPGRILDDALRRERFWQFNDAVGVAQARAFAALPLARRVEHIDAVNASMAELGTIRLRPTSIEVASRDA